MSKTPWIPWHEVVRLRDDVRSGELSLAIFAADLYEVAMGKARPVYQDPREFFALTYPTFNLRELCKDVVLRLAGKNEKAVRQLELTYGGGKTHTLITLYHLVHEPSRLPDMPAVQEFVQHIGQPPSRARVAALCFDKLDPEKGAEVKGPQGESRWLTMPWSVLAFQIAGSEGLRLLHAENLDMERESPPAENLLVDLLAFPEKENLSTLILLDEVLTYVRGKVGLDPVWRWRLIDFFQYLTQAATKIDRCAIVASLLATDPRKSDALGKELTQELYAIFRREREEGVEPVVKEDVAEVLRRRFFTPESLKDREVFRPHVVAAVKNIGELDEQTRKDKKAVEDRFARSFPFHPDLTDIFYTKWTNLEGFQRTRGILRTFAMALREAEKWDKCPLVAANVFLGEPGKGGISEAARELTTVATTEEYEGKKQEWTGILEGELAKAREIQAEIRPLRFREIEQAVVATFLHSQPIGQKALTRELLVLLGQTKPDKIELEKGLKRWAEESWFLDEASVADAEVGPDGQKQLPKSWRLGSKPNLKQMHSASLNRVAPEVVESRLLDEIAILKSLTAGASAAGARVHNLPIRPKDIEDDGEFHYAVLGPSAASKAGEPSAVAKQFLDETTSADKPRVYRNALVLAVPSRDGLEAIRNIIRDHLGWLEVQFQLKGQEVDPIRAETLAGEIERSKKKIPAAIQQAYCLVVTVSEKNEVQAFKIAVNNEPLFNLIKKDSRSRIQETAVSAEALLPEGPYDLWREGETSRRVKDLVGAFAQFPHLPKMLNRKAILDTLLAGCREGLFVLSLRRPDRSVRTWWRELPDDNALKDPGLEVVLPEAAALSDLPYSLLIPGVLPGLWESSEISLQDLYAYFVGGKVVNIPKEGYEEPVTIPKAEKEVVDAAVHLAVRSGKLWLTSGPASILAEDIPSGLLTSDAILQGPPRPISPLEILPENLPAAWSDQRSTGLSVSVALSKKVGKTLPWVTVRESIDSGFRARMIERALDSGPWPCDFSGAQNVRIILAKGPPPPPPPPPPPLGVLLAEAELQPNQIQDLAEQIADIKKAAVGLDLKFRIRIELGGVLSPSAEPVVKINQILEEISEKLKLK